MSTPSQTNAPQKRFAIAHLDQANSPRTPDEGRDLIQGLTQPQKSLPCRYLYDDRGSQIFERICTLPEYYLTRTETEILQQYADEIAQTTGTCELVELGSGSSTKTRLLLDAYARLGPLRYIPIDVSAGILKASAEQLLADYPTLEVLGVVGTYQQGLQQLPPSPLPARLIFFLGSTLGNFSPEECNKIFTQVTSALAPGDYFLLGIDLADKPKEILEAAYNDSQGVTAEFNYNLLDHLNRRFGGNFDRALFEHWTFYNPELAQIETYLRVKKAHTVRLEALDLKVELASGEAIRTEISRKFYLQQMHSALQVHGLQTCQLWTDAKQWFALLLCQLQP